MRATTAMPGGIVAALFGRMVTSDPAANVEAPIHVAHAFTVHAEETEGDYFTALDDLDAGNGTATIQDTELTSGIFYGYSVVDIEQLVSNVGDASLAGSCSRTSYTFRPKSHPGPSAAPRLPIRGRNSFSLSRRSSAPEPGGRVS